MPQSLPRTIFLLLTTCLVLAYPKSWGEGDHPEGQLRATVSCGDVVCNRKKGPTLIVDACGVPCVECAGGEPVAVTGEVVYPTPVNLAALHLREWLTPEQRTAVTFENTASQTIASSKGGIEREMTMPSLREFAAQKRKILDVGAGFGGLVPFFHNRGVDVLAVDLCYGKQIPQDSLTQEYMGRYTKKYGKLLLFGDATELPRSIQDNSIDLVISHMVYQYLSNEGKKKMIREALRVTKSGGTIRIFPSDDPGLVKFLNELRHEGQKFEYLIASNDLKATARLLPDGSFPTDSFDWATFQRLLFEPLLGRPLSGQFKGKPLPLLQCGSCLSGQTLIIKKL